MPILLSTVLTFRGRDREFEFCKGNGIIPYLFIICLSNLMVRELLPQYLSTASPNQCAGLGLFDGHPFPKAFPGRVVLTAWGKDHGARLAMAYCLRRSLVYPENRDTICILGIDLLYQNNSDFLKYSFCLLNGLRGQDGKTSCLPYGFLSPSLKRIGPGRGLSG